MVDKFFFTLANNYFVPNLEQNEQVSLVVSAERKEQKQTNLLLLILLA